MFGGLNSEHLWMMGSDCGPLRRRHIAETAVPFPSAARRLLNLLLDRGWGYRGWFMNESARSKRIENVVSLRVTRECARPPRDGSDRHVSKRSNPDPMPVMTHRRVRKLAVDALSEMVCTF